MNQIETFEALVERHGGGGGRRVRLADALRPGGGDPLNVIAYLAGLGIPVRTLDDILAINGDPTEEELHAWRVTEGVAVSVASDGLWLLYEP